MKITPLEIRQKTFEKAFRGVDRDEVQAFLLTLSQQWEKMNDENKDLKMKLEVATRDVQKMREVESSLYKTLKTAEDTGANMVEQANKSAELKIREAQLEADKLLNDARQKARSVIEDAYKQSEKAISDMKQEVKSLEQEHRRMETYVDNLVRDLQNLATDVLDKVEKSKAKPKQSISSILSQAANVKTKEIEMEKELLREAPIKPVSANTPKINRAAETKKEEPVAAKEADQYPHPGQPEVVPPTHPEIPTPGIPQPVVPEPDRRSPTIPDPTIPHPQPTIPEPTPEPSPTPAPQPQTPPPHSKSPEKVLSETSFFDDL